MNGYILHPLRSSYLISGGVCAQFHDAIDTLLDMKVSDEMN